MSAETGKAMEASAYVDSLIARASAAQKVAAQFTQEKVDEIVGAVAYAMTRDDVKHELATLALEETKLGDYESKIGKLENKIKGVYYDIKDEKTVGVVEEIKDRGLIRIAKPVGVIAELVPSTQPEVLPVTAALFALKSRNAVVYGPHPRGKATSLRTVEIMRSVLKAHGAPEDLLICADKTSIEISNLIMQKSDLIVATGGGDMVKAAYSSGKPAYGVGAGNANLLVDDTADLKDAAMKTLRSKTADLAAGCSCDNALVIYESVYDDMIKELEAVGGYMCNAEETDKIRKALFPEWPANHVLNRDIVARPAKVIADAAGIDIPENTKFIMVEETGSGEAHPFSGEKLSLVLAIFKCKDLQDGINRINANHAYSGAGHSCGIYSKNQDNIVEFALQTRTTRVNVNLANSLTNTGDWGVGYPFTNSLGCGTWGGNIASENIVLKHYLNNTWIAKPIDRKKPTDEELFGDYLASQK